MPKTLSATSFEVRAKGKCELRPKLTAIGREKGGVGKTDNNNVKNRIRPVGLGRKIGSSLEVSWPASGPLS